MGSLSFSGNNTQFTICIANSFWIHYLFREFTLFQIFVSWIHIFSVHLNLFANSLFCSRNHSEFFSCARIWYECTIYIANSLLIQYYFRKCKMNFISVSGIHYRFFSFWIICLRWVSLFHYEFTILIVFSLWLILQWLLAQWINFSFCLSQIDSDFPKL